MKRSGLAVLLCAAICLVAAIWIYDRHHFSVLWPADVQRTTLGNEVANADALISKERSFSQFGEGFARWRYKANGLSLDHLCGQVAVDQCGFTRSKTLEEGVTVSVTLSGGILTVEEWWS